MENKVEIQNRRTTTEEGRGGRWRGEGMVAGEVGMSTPSSRLLNCKLRVLEDVINHP